MSDPRVLCARSIRIFASARVCARVLARYLEGGQLISANSKFVYSGRERILCECASSAPERLRGNDKYSFLEKVQSSYPDLMTHALVQTSSTNSYPDLTPFFRSIQLSFEEFDRWRKARGWPKPSFWRRPAASTCLQKRKRGRRPEYNWEKVKTCLRAYAEKSGPISTYEELVQKCADFAANLHPCGKTPDDSTIRDAIKKYELDQPPICRPSE
jgi:hypothetical protein